MERSQEVFIASSQGRLGGQLRDFPPIRQARSSETGGHLFHRPHTFRPGPGQAPSLSDCPASAGLETPTAQATVEGMPASRHRSAIAEPRSRTGLASRVSLRIPPASCLYRRLVWRGYTGGRRACVGQRLARGLCPTSSPARQSRPDRPGGLSAQWFGFTASE